LFSSLPSGLIGDDVKHVSLYVDDVSIRVMVLETIRDMWSIRGR
jgi:hypothetical protein